MDAIKRTDWYSRIGQPTEFDDHLVRVDSWKVALEFLDDRSQANDRDRYVWGGTLVGPWDEMFRVQDLAPDRKPWWTNARRTVAKLLKTTAATRLLPPVGMAVRRPRPRVRARHHVALVGPPGCGAHALARFIHETTPTRTWPYVVPEKIPAGDTNAQRALVAKAAYGTLVLDASNRAVRAEKLPRLFELIADNAYHVRLVVIAAAGTTLEPIVGERVRSLLDVVTVPALEARRGELPILLPETIAHHCAQHGATSDMLGAADLATLEALAVGKGRVRITGHDELEEVVGRLVVLRKHVSASEAERELGMKSRGALSKWAAKYGIALNAPGRPRGR